MHVKEDIGSICRDLVFMEYEKIMQRELLHGLFQWQDINCEKYCTY